jgi:hypothetical protein
MKDSAERRNHIKFSMKSLKKEKATDMMASHGDTRHTNNPQNHVLQSPHSSAPAVPEWPM